METTVQRKRLTKKQVFFVHEVALGTPQTLAAMKAYNVQGKDKVNIAGSIAVRNMNKPVIAAAIEAQTVTLKEALQNEGVTPKKIAQKVNELLDSDEGNIIDKGLKHATNIYGVESLDKPKVSNTYNFLFNPEAQQEIRVLEAKIKAKILNVPEVEENNKAE